MTGNNIIAGLLAGLLGMPGDLFSRIFLFNCTLDKAWTMMLFLPPMSFVTGILYFIGKIEKGTESCGTAFDSYIFIIPVLTILFKIGFKYLIENDFISTGITFFLTVVMYAVIRMLKYNSRCKNLFQEKYKGFGKQQVIKGITTSLITNLVIAVLNAVSPFAMMIPVLGFAFRIWSYLGNVPGLQTALPLMIAHIITNLLENNKSRMISTCCKPEDGC